jgi:K+-transporting ATPase ATPase A chain
MILLPVLKILGYAVLLAMLTKPLGRYIARVFAGERTLLTPVVAPLEHTIYRSCGIDPRHEMRWTTYAITMLVFSSVSILALYGVVRLQSFHPWNPMHRSGLRPDLAFNLAVSFGTNTNWQSYSPENTVSYFTQMAGLAYQNFVSAATGIVLAMALIRGLTRERAQHIGNFWVDMTRCLLYILLPFAIVGSLLLVSQGVIQNLSPYRVARTVEGAKQTIPQGPVASQEIIKVLGTNGGGFFNANAAHPYENPSPLTNWIEMLAIFAIPAALTCTFGRYARDQRQGWALFAACMILFLAGAAALYGCEQYGNPILTKAGADQRPDALQPGGNMEGKEVRFGPTESALFATITTDASCGAVNCMHDSLTPLAGMVALLDIALGEVVFGGVGAGLLGLLVFALLAVFIAGLMVGRTPEYLGKKIGSKEMKLAMLAVVILAAGTLGCAALAVSIPAGMAPGSSGPSVPGPHGLTQILYATTSAAGNNGSAFAGLNANNPFYNTILGLAMLIGRFAFLIPIMAIAGSMARKKVTPPSGGTFPTTGGMFVVLLIGVILIVGALTYFPAYALGPIVEHYFMHAGRVF